MSENNLTVNDLIYPIFITYGSNIKEEVTSMPGIYRISLDLLYKEIDYISSLDIPAIALFPKIQNELKPQSDGVAKPSFSFQSNLQTFGVKHNLSSSKF